MKIYWSPQAAHHLDLIFEHIALSSERYAKQTVAQLIGRVTILKKFPHAGRVVPDFDEEDLRELLEGSYRIIYIPLDETIEIIAVIHQSRSLKKEWLVKESKTSETE